MTEPTLPPDIAAAINKLVFWSHRAGETYRDSEVCEKHAARAALEAVILGHLPVWKEIGSAPKDGTDFLAYWLRRRPNGERYEAHQPYVIAHHYRGDFYPLWLRKDPPTHWQPLPSPPPTDIGRSALAEEGRGE